jgi:hypothetical protein
MFLSIMNTGREMGWQRGYPRMDYNWLEEDGMSKRKWRGHSIEYEEICFYEIHLKGRDDMFILHCVLIGR